MIYCWGVVSILHFSILLPGPHLKLLFGPPPRTTTCSTLILHPPLKLGLPESTTPGTEVMHASYPESPRTPFHISLTSVHRQSPRSCSLQTHKYYHFADYTSTRRSDYSPSIRCNLYKLVLYIDHRFVLLLLTYKVM